MHYRINGRTQNVTYAVPQEAAYMGDCAAMGLTNPTEQSSVVQTNAGECVHGKHD